MSAPMTPDREQIRAEVDRLRARVAELEAQHAAALALHRTYDDSAHCVADDEPWPCTTRTALGQSAPALTEDPHDGPLHHSYAVGRDLPEADPARCHRDGGAS
ncbi:hypothetical protein ACFY9Q_01300 [Streptomyces sp. NPDC012389]|uniref:hypothetical protein n=1 Tax=Streptomyces sp. NPDC012389 TaxID=3364830 RepID=UPI0036E642A5